MFNPFPAIEPTNRMQADPTDPRHDRIAALLAFLSPAVAEKADVGHPVAVAALSRIVFDRPGELCPRGAQLPSGPMLVAPEIADTDDGELECEVRFADDGEVPWPLGGRRVCIRLPSGTVPLQPHGNERVLAASAEGPLWLVGQRGEASVFRTALPLPGFVGAGSKPSDIGVDALIRLLPVLHLMRLLAGPAAYRNPPLRAAFIIDDPNLHWPRYGYADYQAIAEDAQRQNYHVAFATIPLDVWFTHQRSAAIFRSNPRVLSLLIHGNNHRKEELAQSYTAQASSALLHQSIARVKVLEAKARMDVSRVMVPPHGACSARVLAQLPAHGFEAACISAGSLRYHNPGQPWTHQLGLGPAELVEGCPVLPRWAFSGTTETSLLCAAFLGQPLILRGHHQDLKDGPDLFGSFAKTINGLGAVQWGNLGDLSRMNYQTAANGTSLRIRPLGTRMEIVVPEGVTELEVEGGPYRWRCLGAAARETSMAGAGFVVSVRPCQSVTLVRDTAAGAEWARVPRTPARLLLRRLVTEARDRLLAY